MHALAATRKKTTKGLFPFAILPPLSTQNRSFRGAREFPVLFEGEDLVFVALLCQEELSILTESFFRGVAAYQ